MKIELFKGSRWSILGYLVGVIFGLGTFVQYYVAYPDNDKFVAYTMIAVLIIGVSWLYNKQMQLSNTLTAVEDYLADKGRKK